MSQELITIETEEAGGRLDKCLAAHRPELSRSRVQQLMAEGCVTCADAIITDASRKVKAGEIYGISLPEAVESRARAVELPLTILYEDAHLLIIDKQAGMTVHPAPGHTDDTLVNALLAHCGDSLSGIGGVMRPGIVHRLDKDTSGLLVVAKHDAAHRHLSLQLAERTLRREYMAVVKGIPIPPLGRIDAPLGRSSANRQKMAVVKSGGRQAVTHYLLEERLTDAALVRCRLETGRTHQIRVHMNHIGHALVGDPLYGRGKKSVAFPRQALHATRLALVHPESEEIMQFQSDMPEDMRELVARLRGE